MEWDDGSCDQKRNSGRRLDWHISDIVKSRINVSVLHIFWLACGVDWSLILVELS